MRARRNTFTARAEPVADIYHVGLVNLGNSCFYNTILQALAVSHPLNDIIAKPPITSPALLAVSPASESYNPDPEALLSPLPLTQALITLLKNLDVSNDPARGKKVFNPKTLLRHLSTKHEEYAQATQQDAHEVLRHLIDGIMMEEVDLIKKVRAAAPKPARRPGMNSRSGTLKTLRAPSNGANTMEPVAEEAPEASTDEDDSSVGGYETEESSSESEDSSSSSSESSEDEEDEDHQDFDATGKPQPRMKPFIASVFDGKLASVVICDECKHVSATTEDFMDISLSLRDDVGNKMRKRDRIRKTLQSGFFSKKSSGERPSSNGSSSSSSTHPRHQPISLSENEASSSSEYETDEDHPYRPDEPHGHDPHFMGGRSRHNSLDPSKLGGQRPTAFLNGLSAANGPNAATSRARDHSPLGRALSVLSSTSGAGSTTSGSAVSGGRRKKKKAKIPKPTAEQIAYIRRLLVEIPSAASAPLPIRIARPPGSPAPPSPSSTANSMASLRLGPDQTSTDLYECFRQFTSVEVLEGDNMFACHNCWKHLNPDLVEKRRVARDNKKRERLLRKAKKGADKRARKDAEAAAMDEITPSPSLAPDSPPARTTPLPSVHANGAAEEEPHVNGDRRPSNATISTLSSYADHKTSSPATFSSVSLHSEPPSLSEFGTTDDEGSALADVEDGNITDTSIDSRAKIPLTTANVEALDDSITPSASAAPSLRNAESTFVNNLAPSESVASLSTAFSSASKPSPALPKTARHILRRAHKRYLISAPDLPPVLVIHLKRFQQTSKSSLFGSSFINLKKRDDDLSFPEDLDLKPFLAPTEKPPRPAGAPPPRHHHRPNPTPMQSEYLVGEAKYSLYAVVVHFGTLVTGHYSAYVKSDRHGKGPGGSSERKWFFCSDEDVRACSLDEVLRSKAYILFYERVKPQPHVVSDSGVIVEEPAAEEAKGGKL